MYIKKPILMITAIILIIVTSVLTVCAVNPFGFTALKEFLYFSSMTKLIEKEYYKDVPTEEYLNTALEGIAYATGDPYTRYIWGNDAKEYVESIEGNFVGVGIYLTYNQEDNSIEVISSIPGTPAEKAGVAAGDKLLSVNGETFTGMQLDDAVNKIRGEAGSPVTVSFWKKDTGVSEDIELIREKIVIPAVESEMLNETTACIRIIQFTENVQMQFATAYQECMEQGMEKLVLDLRNNPGGIMEEATMIANMFIDAGEIVVYTMDKAGERMDYVASGEKLTIPMVILTNEASASASEILTGALKDYGVAYHIGEKTHGKGIVQGVFQVTDNAVLSITQSRYYTPKGICIHETGIMPDEVIEMDDELYVHLDELSIDQDIQLQRAIAWLER